MSVQEQIYFFEPTLCVACTSPKKKQKFISLSQKGALDSSQHKER